MKIPSIFTSMSLIFISVWQYVFSPFLGNHCRYYPSCSSYTEQALREHGFFKGWALGLKRILRCNSLFPGGVDYVPKNK